MTEVLYILMRNDLKSMNSGKAIAQGSHAANAFVNHFNNYKSSVKETDTKDKIEKFEHLNNSFYKWKNSTSQGFGTVLVLEVPMSKIYSAIDILSKDYIAGVVYDPTYPILDGDVVHHIPLDTCGYVFVENKEEDITAAAVLSQIPLHR